jgi:hypothetical protein
LSISMQCDIIEPKSLGFEYSERRGSEWQTKKLSPK